MSLKYQIIDVENKRGNKTIDRQYDRLRNEKSNHRHQIFLVFFSRKNEKIFQIFIFILFFYKILFTGNEVIFIARTMQIIQRKKDQNKKKVQRFLTNKNTHTYNGQQQL